MDLVEGAENKSQMPADHVKVDSFFSGKQRQGCKNCQLEYSECVLLIQLSSSAFHPACFPGAPPAYAAALTMPSGRTALPRLGEDSCFIVTVHSRAEGENKLWAWLGRP